MVDFATLAIRADSRSLPVAVRDLRSVETGAVGAERAVRNMERSTKTVAGGLRSAFSGLSGSVLSLRNALTGGALAYATREVFRYGDAWTRAQNQLRVAGLEGERLDQTLGKLFESAQSNAAPLEALVTLYGRASMVQKELGVSSERMLLFTERVAQALRLSGRSAQESSGALLQLSQALGSGVVRAEEFNSLLEGAYPIALAAARGLTEAGGSVAKLRNLIIEGKVSSQAFFQAFLAGSQEFERQISSMQMTLGQGFTQIGNSSTRLAGEFLRVTTASKTAGEGLSAVARGIDSLAANEDQLRRVADIMERIAGAWVGMKVGSVGGPWGKAIGGGLGLMLPELRETYWRSQAQSSHVSPDNSLASNLRTSSFAKSVPGVPPKTIPIKPGGEDIGLADEREKLTTMRLQNEALTAQVSGNDDLARELRTQAEIRSTISDKLRTDAPELAANMEQQIRLEAELNKQIEARKKYLDQIGEYVSATTDGMTAAFDAFIENGKIGFEQLREIALDVFRDIARAAFQQGVIGPITKGIMSAFGGAGGGGDLSGGSLGSIAGQIYHGGGKVGPGHPVMRLFPAHVFAGAPRLHSGLAPDEFPAVLQRGERVLRRGEDGGGISIQMAPITIYADGADRHELERVRLEVRALRENQAAVSLKAVQEAKSRRMG